MNIKKRSIEEVLGGLKNTEATKSIEAAADLLHDMRNSGVGMREYLNQAIDLSNKESAFAANLSGSNMTGYEAALAYLNLPLKDDKIFGMALATASDTFATYPGTSALFPVYQEDVLRINIDTPWNPGVSSLVASSIEVTGNQVQWDVADWNDANFVALDGSSFKTFIVAEGAEIPTRSVKSSKTSVAMYKHGAGYKFTEEFMRRAKLDVISPFLAEVTQTLELSKTNHAVY